MRAAYACEGVNLKGKDGSRFGFYPFSSWICCGEMYPRPWIVRGTGIWVVVEYAR